MGGLYILSYGKHQNDYKIVLRLFLLYEGVEPKNIVGNTYYMRVCSQYTVSS